MNNQLTVSLADCIANGKEECHYFAHSAALGPFVNGHAFHQFHHQIRARCSGGFIGVTHVQKSCNVGVSEGRQNLAFLQEALQSGGIASVAANQLNGYFNANFAVSPFGPIDGTHAARAQ